MRVLIIEKDKEIIKDINFCLHVRYPDVTIISAEQGRQGLEMVESESPDLCMLGDSVHDGDVVDLINNIRVFSEIPLIVLTCKHGDLDRSKILEAGADEYINKPFSPIELLAVVKATMRRIKGTDFRASDLTKIDGRLSVNLNTNEVFLEDKSIKLTPTEFKILSKLIRNDGRVVTTSHLLDTVWGSDYVTETGYVKKYINRLRKKLEKDPHNPKLFLTERGLGYKLVKSP